MKLIKSIIKYIILLILNLLKIIKDMLFNEQNTKKIFEIKKRKEIKEEKKIIPRTFISEEDETANKTIEQNYEELANKFFDYALEKKYEIKIKYFNNVELKEYEKIKETVVPKIKEIIKNNQSSSLYNKTIDLIEEYIKTNESIKEFKKYLEQEKSIKKEINKENITKEKLDEIEKKIEEYLDEEFIEEEIITDIKTNNFIKVIEQKEHIKKEKNINPEILDEEKETTKEETNKKETNYEEEKKKDKQDKLKKEVKQDEDKKEETKEEKTKEEEIKEEEKKKDDYIFNRIINNIKENIDYFKNALLLEETKDEIENKNYDTLINNLNKKIKKFEYELITYKNQLTVEQKNIIRNNLDKLYNIGEKIELSLESDIKKEENQLSSIISDEEINTIYNELDNVTTNVDKYNLNRLEDLDTLNEEDKETLEKQILLDKLKEIMNIKSSKIFRKPFMKKNYFLDFSTSLLINANIKQLHNIINHVTNDSFTYDLSTVNNNSKALSLNESLTEDNVDELQIFKETLIQKKPKLAIDPEINLYLNMVDNNLNITKDKTEKKQTAIKNYCYKKVRKRILQK